MEMSVPFYSKQGLGAPWKGRTNSVFSNRSGEECPAQATALMGREKDRTLAELHREASRQGVPFSISAGDIRWR